ncbi:RagB/SusD family nutrient uptake outer membrane protein [Bacteroidia bacterium]|nr:RagB/SusD family nutrient uptake outer membrane protein [Bacteroidia bacterium]MDB4107600.1 RagB/SusD family nutrient uptake outer membrane protein [Bacteroidia bacterium]MDB9883135.1 RagB/SusD family nutrient uptake outer membrane protein [Bacteroidia bacterium]
MKKIISIFLLLFCFSCTKFDETVYDKSLNQKPSLINVYKELGDIIDDNGWWFWAQEVSSDEVVFPVRGNDWNDGGKWKVLHTHEWSNDVDAVNSMWSHLDDGIREANKVIDPLLDQVSDPLIAKEVAKARTLRAFFMYLMMDNYGDIPLVTSFVSAVPQPFKESRENIHAFLVKEVEESAPLLDVSTNKFAVSKGMAYTLLAKLYINAEIYTGNPAFDKAEAFCDSVINLGTYTLEGNVTNAFSASNDNSSENIFTIPFDENDFRGFRLHMRTLHYLNDASFNMGVGPWNGFAIVEDHYDSYDNNDLRKKDWFLVGQQFDAGGAPLFDETAGESLILTPKIPKLVMDASNTSAEIRMSGARVQKYEIEEGAIENLNNDFPLFRYADVLLMKAECAVRNGSAGAGDSYVAEVRDRANAGPTTGFGLDDILAERGRELFCEGHRRQDLIRFSKFGDSWWEKPASGIERTTFPIPQWAIDANPNLGL